MGLFSRKRQTDQEATADERYANMGGPFEEENYDPAQMQPRQSRLAAKSKFYREVIFSATAKNRSVGFWHPSLRSTRKQALLKWIAMTLFLGTMIFCLLCLYWGSLMRVYKNYPSLTVWIVDMDGQVAPYDDVTPILGPLVVDLANQRNADPITPHLGYIVRRASDFNYDTKQVWRGVYEEHAWAAFIINTNATSLLRRALTEGNSSYDPMGAMQLVWNEARDQTTVDEFIFPDLVVTQNMIREEFARVWTPQALQLTNSTAGLRNAALVPQAINPGVGFSQYNLRPFSALVATPTVTVGLIYLIILSFFSFAFYNPIHASFIDGKGHKPLNFFQLVIYRLISTIVAYFFLSFFYSLVSLSFRVPFSRQPAPPDETAESSAYGRASFVVYWMINWLGTMALGLASENVGLVLGFPWFALWLIFWVITNVATSFYPIPVEPGFFRYGFAWPLHNIVEATRTIIFDTHSRIGLNIGILCAWIAVNIMLFPLCNVYFRWNKIKSSQKQNFEKEQDDEVKAESE